jgi:hypothetical protein
VTRLRRCRVRDATGCARLPAGDRGGRSQHRDGAGASTGLIIGAEVHRSAAPRVDVVSQPLVRLTHRGAGPGFRGRYRAPLGALSMAYTGRASCLLRDKNRRECAAPAPSVTADRRARGRGDRRLTHARMTALGSSWSHPRRARLDHAIVRPAQCSVMSSRLCWRPCRAIRGREHAAQRHGSGPPAIPESAAAGFSRTTPGARGRAWRIDARFGSRWR